MIWGFSCCCSPSPGENAKKVSPSPKSREAASPDRGAADGRPQQQPADAGARTGSSGAAGAAASPVVARPAREEAGALVQQDAEETVSVVSSRSAKSARSMGTSSSVASELIENQIPARQREKSRIQQAMKAFVRTMVRGQQLGVISPNGQLRTCSGSLDKRIKHLIIELKGSVRRIALTEIQEVFQGKEPEDIDTPLDELCSTLMLESGECISFTFPDVPSRENFAMCLQILVDGQFQ
mmetsp:Transcript_59338/g.133674  ORF Transcript_59338/g.133674 Transcript_59338/m.133674 type:complete len:239 (+) Transcript_59338:94-810(+)